jgi:hypothetical protein
MIIEENGERYLLRLPEHHENYAELVTQLEKCETLRDMAAYLPKA